LFPEGFNIPSLHDLGRLDKKEGMAVIFASIIMFSSLHWTVIHNKKGGEVDHIVLEDSSAGSGEECTRAYDFIK